MGAFNKIKSQIEKHASNVRLDGTRRNVAEQTSFVGLQLFGVPADVLLKAEKVLRKVGRNDVLQEIEAQKEVPIWKLVNQLKTKKKTGGSNMGKVSSVSTNKSGTKSIAGLDDALRRSGITVTNDGQNVVRISKTTLGKKVFETKLDKKKVSFLQDNVSLGYNKHIVTNPVGLHTDNGLQGAVGCIMSMNVFRYDTGLYDNAMIQMLIKLRQTHKGGLPYSEADFKTAVKDTMEFYAMYITLSKVVELAAKGMFGNPDISKILLNQFPDLASDKIAQTRASLVTYKNFINSSIVLPKSLSNYLLWRYGTVFKMKNVNIAAPMLYNMVNGATTDYSDYLTKLEAQYQTVLSHSMIFADLRSVYKHNTSGNYNLSIRFDHNEKSLRDNIASQSYQRLDGLVKAFIPGGDYPETQIAGSLISTSNGTDKSPIHESVCYAFIVTSAGLVGSQNVNSFYTDVTAADATGHLSRIMMVIACGYENPEFGCNITGEAGIVAPQMTSEYRYLSPSEVQEYHAQVVTGLFDQ